MGRRLSGALAPVLIGSLLAGCGGSSAPETVTAVVPAPASTSTPAGSGASTSSSSPAQGQGGSNAQTGSSTISKQGAQARREGSTAKSTPAPEQRTSPKQQRTPGSPAAERDSRSALRHSLGLGQTIAGCMRRAEQPHLSAKQRTRIRALCRKLFGG